MPIKKGTQLKGIRTIDDVRVRCNVDADSGCWLWKLGDNGFGYPNAWFPTYQATHSVRVGVYRLTHDGKLPGKRMMQVKCGNKGCVCPTHLVASTYSQIFTGVPKTPLHAARSAAAVRSRSKLTEESAREIREHQGPLIEMAEKFGISYSHAHRVARGHAWRSVKAPNSSAFTFRP